MEYTMPLNTPRTDYARGLYQGHLPNLLYRLHNIKAYLAYSLKPLNIGSEGSILKVSSLPVIGCLKVSL